jgi:hypothetical protein
MHWDESTAGLWQPQVQAAPVQGLQLQGLVSMFMMAVLESAQAAIGLWDKVWAL